MLGSLTMFKVINRHIFLLGHVNMLKVGRLSTLGSLNSGYLLLPLLTACCWLSRRKRTFVYTDTIPCTTEDHAFIQENLDSHITADGRGYRKILNRKGSLDHLHLLSKGTLKLTWWLTCGIQSASSF